MVEEVVELKKNLSRASWLSIGFGTISILFAIIIFLIQDKRWSETAIYAAVTGPLFFIGGIAGLIHFRAVEQAEQQNQRVQQLPLLADTSELIVQPVVGWMPAHIFVTSTGEEWLSVRPQKQQGLVARLLLFIMGRQALTFPWVRYSFEAVTPDGSLLGRYTTQFTLKEIRYAINDESNNRIAEILFPTQKNLLRSTGVILKEEPQVMIEFQADNLSGDIDIYTETNLLLLSYRFGRFPYATSPLFQFQAVVPYAKLAKELSQEEKWVSAVLLLSLYRQ